MHLDGVQARQTNIFRELETDGIYMRREGSLTGESFVVGWTELDLILFQMCCSTGQTSCALLRLNCVQSCNES